MLCDRLISYVSFPLCKHTNATDKNPMHVLKVQYDVYMQTNMLLLAVYMKLYYDEDDVSFNIECTRIILTSVHYTRQRTEMEERQTDDDKHREEAIKR